MWVLINFLQAVVVYTWTILTALIFIPVLPYRLNHWFAYRIYSPSVILMLGGRLKVNGRENIKNGGPYIFMANHASFSDIPILFASTRMPLHFIAKKELKKGVFGPPIICMRMIFVDRESAQKSIESVRKAAETVRDGKNLVIFPEGTRTKTGKMGIFKKGSFKLALQSGVPIVPVGITGASTIVARNNFRFRPAKVNVNIGKPIETETYEEKDISLLIDKVKQEIQNLL